MAHKTLVVGTGITGRSVMRYLQNMNIDFDVFDTRFELADLSILEKQYPKATFYLADDSKIDWQVIELVIVSPGIAPSTPVIAMAKSLGIKVAGDLEIFAKHQQQKPLIVISGTNGKSTVTTLVSYILEYAGLKVALAGNIGLGMLDSLADDYDYYDVWLLELSSFQLFYQESLQATIACLLNISEDHTDWHGSFASYQKAKHKIFSKSKTQIYNADDELTKINNTNTSTSFSGLGKKTAGFYLLDGKFFKANNYLFSIEELTLTGTHNFENILAALAIVDAFGIDKNITIEAIKKFKGLEHRSQNVRTLDGVTWVNDSKGTNVGATLAALKGIGAALKGKIIWLAGGVGKGANFSPLAKPLESFVSFAVLFGEDKAKIASNLPKGLPYKFVDSMAEAVNVANANSNSGDCVLLSPACASFDMFENYIKRGESFSRLVEKL